MNRLNEHLWSGIIRRSETGELRKEDDVDLLDNNQFQEYLNNHYEIIGYDGHVSYPNLARTADFIYLCRNDYNVYIVKPRTRVECILDVKLPIFYDDIDPNLKNTFLSDEFKNKYIKNELDVLRYKTNIQTNKDVLHFIDDFIKMPKPDDFDNEKMITKVKN